MKAADEDTMPGTLQNSQKLLVHFATFLPVMVIKVLSLCDTMVLILLLLYWFCGSLVVLLLVIIASLSILYRAQDKLLYYPDQPPHSRFYVERPKSLGLPSDEAYVTTSDNVRIHLTLINQVGVKMATVPTIIYFHGNAGNVGHRLVNAYDLHHICGVNVLLVEYRGYGRSCGHPSEEGLYRDSEAALQYVLNRPDLNGGVVVFGRSLGGAVALQLAHKYQDNHRVRAVIVENTFTSLPHIAKHIFHFAPVHFLPRICFKNQYKSLSRVEELHLPVLFLSGLADKLIPPSMMLKLCQRCGSTRKFLITFPGGTHNETWQCKGYYENINRFLMDSN